jgi:hypothetical protein
MAYPDVPRDVPGRWGSRWARLVRVLRRNPTKRSATAPAGWLGAGWLAFGGEPRSARTLYYCLDKDLDSAAADEPWPLPIEHGSHCPQPLEGSAGPLGPSAELHTARFVSALEVADPTEHRPSWELGPHPAGLGAAAAHPPGLTAGATARPYALSARTPSAVRARSAEALRRRPNGRGYPWAHQGQACSASAKARLTRPRVAPGGWSDRGAETGVLHRIVGASGEAARAA